MHLYLLRHADADTVAENDDERFLSEKGVLQTQRVARFCEAHDIKPSLIFSSHIRRALQTAKLVADHLHSELRAVRWLACGADPVNVLTQVSEYANLPSIMLVGHAPDFSQLAAHLIGGNSADNVHIRKATLAYFTVHEFKAGGARLEFLLPVKLM